MQQDQSAALTLEEEQALARLRKFSYIPAPPPLPHLERDEVLACQREERFRQEFRDAIVPTPQLAMAEKVTLHALGTMPGVKFFNTDKTMKGLFQSVDALLALTAMMKHLVVVMR